MNVPLIVRILGTAVFGSLPLVMAAPAFAAQSPGAIERMQQPGAEAKQLADLAGRWAVTMTLRHTPDAKPVITSGLIAERKMVGLFLEETMQPAPNSGMPDFRRIAYLTWSKVEGRWQYVSLDTRLPVGIMPAWSFGKQMGRELTLLFEPLGFVGMGEQVEGRLMRSNLVITREGPDHDTARQHWVVADGSEREWVAVEYEYTRQK